MDLMLSLLYSLLILQLSVQPNPSFQVSADDSLTCGDTLVAIIATMGLLPQRRSRSFDSLLPFHHFSQTHIVCARPHPAGIKVRGPPHPATNSSNNSNRNTCNSLNYRTIDSTNQQNAFFSYSAALRLWRFHHYY